MINLNSIVLEGTLYNENGKYILETDMKGAKALVTTIKTDDSELMGKLLDKICPGESRPVRLAGRLEHNMVVNAEYIEFNPNVKHE